jgi:hypothetical protein
MSEFAATVLATMAVIILERLVERLARILFAAPQPKARIA